MSIERYFVSGFTRRRITRTATTLGGWTETTSDLSLSGRLRPLSGDERLSADKQTLYATHRFYCAAGTDILTGDLLLYGGQRFRVKYPADPMSMGRFLQVDLEESGHDG